MTLGLRSSRLALMMAMAVWMLVSLASTTTVDAATSTRIRVRVTSASQKELHQQQHTGVKTHEDSDDSDDDSTTADSAELATRDCEINGLKLRHHSLHYYGEKTYVACSHGRAGCYLEERVHAHATQISCPHGDELKHKMTRHEEDERRRRLSLAVVDEKRKWSKGVVCYAFNAEYPFDKTQLGLIAEAMHSYEKETNVRFVPLQTCKDKKMTQYCNGCGNYVDFKHPPTGRDCNSSIGITTDGPQIMNLADRCFEGDGSVKNNFGTAMHEIGHALGLYHEHQHPQRQVAVFWDDIPQSVWGEMKIRDVSQGGAYDPDSVMHYPQSYGFCYPRFCTASVKTDCVAQGTKFCNLNDDSTKCVQPSKNLCDESKTQAIGQRRFLSGGDLEALHDLYPTAMWSPSQSLIA